MTLTDLGCLQADRERAMRQREYLAQLEEDSEPTSLATTTEGEHTIQVVHSHGTVKSYNFKRNLPNIVDNVQFAEFARM